MLNIFNSNLKKFHISHIENGRPLVSSRRPLVSRRSSAALYSGASAVVPGRPTRARTSGRQRRVEKTKGRLEEIKNQTSSQLVSCDDYVRNKTSRQRNYENRVRCQQHPNHGPAAACLRSVSAEVGFPWLPRKLSNKSYFQIRSKNMWLFS